MLTSTESKVQVRMRNVHTLVYEECDLSDAEAERQGLHLATVLKNSGLYVVVITSQDYARPLDDELTPS